MFFQPDYPAYELAEMRVLRDALATRRAAGVENLLIVKLEFQTLAVDMAGAIEDDCNNNNMMTYLVFWVRTLYAFDRNLHRNCSKKIVE